MLLRCPLAMRQMLNVNAYSKVSRSEKISYGTASERILPLNSGPSFYHISRLHIFMTLQLSHLPAEYNLMSDVNIADIKLDCRNAVDAERSERSHNSAAWLESQARNFIAAQVNCIHKRIEFIVKLPT